MALVSNNDIYCIKNGNIDKLKQRLAFTMCPRVLEDKRIKRPCKVKQVHGHLDACIVNKHQYLEGRDLPLYKMVKLAAKHGHGEMVVWLLDTFHDDFLSYKVSGCYLPHEAEKTAAKYGRISVLKAMVSSGHVLFCTKTLVKAVRHGHFDIVEWMYDGYFHNSVASDIVETTKKKLLNAARTTCMKKRLEALFTKTYDDMDEDFERRYPPKKW